MHKISVAGLLLSLSFIFVMSASADDNQQDIPARTMIIELNKTPEGKQYQVQINSDDQSWARPYEFDLNGDSPVLQLRLTPGSYRIRTRTFDEQGYYGPWSTWSQFWVRFKPITTVYPADGAKVRPKSTMVERLTFEWPPSGGKAYFFQLRDEKGNVKKEGVVKNPWMITDVELQSKFSWAIVPMSNESEYSMTELQELMKTAKFFRFETLGPPQGAKDVTVFAKEMEHVERYQYEFLKLDRLGERGGAALFDSNTPDFKISMAPGMYEVRLRTFFKDGSVSDWSPPSRFFVPYLKVKIKEPITKAFVDPTDDERAKVYVAWEPQPDVHHYLVHFYDINGKYITTTRTETNETMVELPADAKYKWTVVPYSTGQNDEPPPPAPDSADDPPEFKIGNYIPLALKASEEPSHLYGWGRYWTSMIDYQSYNTDGNSKVVQPIFGGTGELAVGYWHRKSRFGALLTGGTSGFWLDDNNKTYHWSYAGLQVGYRKFLENGNRLRLWGGINYQEFPEIKRDPFVMNFDYYRVKNYGPSFQISYMGDFDRWPKYGYHGYSTFYYSTVGLETPNKLPQHPQLSYTLGVFGTYKYSEDQKWMIGYSYKKESVTYDTNDRSQKANYSETTGHYLNLSIEIGLDEHYK